ncbi:MAG: ABC transporter ATP-binding protein [Planctomycetota bacterium]|jgi:putative ABC transport system ATP-binding protein
MITLQDVKFHYEHGDFHLCIDVLKIEPGQSVAVIGPSGSGKTTLLNLIAGISVPQSGMIQTGDTIVNQLSDQDRRQYRIQKMGLVFQDFELLSYLNVMDNILLPYWIHNGQSIDKKIRIRARELAKKVGIDDKLQRYTQQMSQGEKQRVAICRALLTNPFLLLADEPTGNLDPKNKTNILNILLEYASSSNATLIVVTHDVNMAEKFDRVIDFSQFYAETGSGVTS